MRHLNSLLALTRTDIEEIFDLSAQLKARSLRGDRPPLLAGRVLTLVFEKPSLRTRVSFEAAMKQLGGDSLFLNATEAGIGGREAIQDVARVLGGYSDVIVLRTFEQQLIEDFITHSGTAIINGLSDHAHPCQALTDLFTMQEAFGSIAGKKFVFVGDGNNVATALAAATAHLGVHFTVCAPREYQLSVEFIAELNQQIPGTRIEQTEDFAAALKDAAVVYTDVWTSMGQEAENEERQRVFGPYQVNAKLMKLAPTSARFMHCLPAKRGKEVTDDVIDGPQSLAFPQADNRLHVGKGILLWALGAKLS